MVIWSRVRSFSSKIDPKLHPNEQKTENMDFNTINNLPSHQWQHILPPILGLFRTVSGYKVLGLLAWTSLQASSMSPFTKYKRFKDWLIIHLTMAKSSFETHVQETMVIVFIILNWIFNLMNTTTKIPCRFVSKQVLAIKPWETVISLWQTEPEWFLFSFPNPIQTDTPVFWENNCY